MPASALSPRVTAPSQPSARVVLPSIPSLRASLAQSSLAEFIRQAWPLIEPTTPLVWNWHLDEICNVLEGITNGTLLDDDGKPVKRVIINIPPGLGKSLVVSTFWPAWEWASDASKRYLTASYSDDNTIRDNRRLRTIVTSTWYRDSFGVELSSDQSAKIRFDTTAKGWRIATSVGGMGTGEHPDRIIIDDPLKAASARSDAEREACNEWADRTLSTRIARDPVVILIMQRLHIDDLSGHLLAKGGWYHIAFPMRYDPSGGLDCECHKDKPDARDHRTVAGELLWEKQWPEEKVRQEEIDLGPFGSSGQLGQKPVPEGGGLFKREWFEFVDIAPASAKRCRGWDTADTKDAGDWTVGAKLAYDVKSGITYVEHVKRERAGPGAIDRLIKSYAETDGKRCMIREGKGSGKATILRRTTELAGYDYAGSPETDDKVTRANPFRAQCEVGNVKIVRGDWNEAYLSVLTSFPVGQFDDDVDASSNAFNALVGVRKRRLTWGR